MSIHVTSDLEPSTSINPNISLIDERFHAARTSRLLHLDLSKISMRHAATVKHLETQALLTHTAFTSLDLSHCGIQSIVSEKGSEHLVEEILTHNSTLQSIKLNWNNLGSSRISKLATALSSNTTLTRLDIGLNEISGLRASSLTEALKVNCTLTVLFLDYNTLTSIGVYSLSAALQVNSSLLALSLKRCSLISQDACRIAEALETNSTLTQLDLSLNTIGDLGAARLAQMLSVNNSLGALSMSNCGFQKTGVECMLSAFTSSSSLHFLELSNLELKTPTLIDTLARLNHNGKERQSTLFGKLLPLLDTDSDEKLL